MLLLLNSFELMQIPFGGRAGMKPSLLRMLDYAFQRLNLSLCLSVSVYLLSVSLWHETNLNIIRRQQAETHDGRFLYCPSEQRLPGVLLPTLT